MKKINKEILVLFALVLSLSLTFGVVLGYFSDFEEASGGASIHLGGRTEIEEGNDDARKVIVIKNTGETNMIVRVAIMGEGVRYFAQGNPSFESKDWWTSEDDQGVLWYYYRHVLEPDQETSSITALMQFSWEGAEVPEHDFDITVVHESTQAVYEGTKLKCPEAWDASRLPDADVKEGE